MNCIPLISGIVSGSLLGLVGAAYIVIESDGLLDRESKPCEAQTQSEAGRPLLTLSNHCDELNIACDPECHDQTSEEGVKTSWKLVATSPKRCTDPLSPQCYPTTCFKRTYDDHGCSGSYGTNTFHTKGCDP